jgi:mannose PTS system EIIA component
MANLLIIAHSPLGACLKTLAQHAFPDCTQRQHLLALDVSPNMSADQVEQQARDLLLNMPHLDTLIFTDVFGATPCNGAQRLAANPHIKVVSGVNVPMLWRALCYAHESLEQLLARALAGGSQGVMQVVTAPERDACAVDAKLSH